MRPWQPRSEAGGERSPGPHRGQAPLDSAPPWILCRRAPRSVVPNAATLETALVVVGFVVLFVLLPHELKGDDFARFTDIERLIHHGELSNRRYSIVMPLVSAPCCCWARSCARRSGGPPLQRDRGSTAVLSCSGCCASGSTAGCCGRPCSCFFRVISDESSARLQRGDPERDARDARLGLDHDRQPHADRVGGDRRRGRQHPGCTGRRAVPGDRRGVAHSPASSISRPVVRLC